MNKANAWSGNPADTHIKLGTLCCQRPIFLQDLYSRLQSEYWSPNGEAKEFVQGKGLTHTSMTVGDLFVRQVGNVRECYMVSWVLNDCHRSAHIMLTPNALLKAANIFLRNQKDLAPWIQDAKQQLGVRQPHLRM